MKVVSTREFRSNQTKIFDMANNGEDVVLKSRKSGCFRLVPVREYDTADCKRDITRELKAALQQVKDSMDGKTELKPAEALLDEIRNMNR